MKSAHETIKTETIRTENNKETGGVLMGYSSKEEEVVITHASLPGHFAMQRKQSIMFDTEYCQDYINKVYQLTNGYITYIGDWHSHTIYDLHPSIIDIKELKRTANSKKSRLKNPIMAIVFGEEDQFGWNILSLDDTKKPYQIDDYLLLDYDIQLKY
jgi:integrative and conjugative element protein (TIGR02256 family)